MAEGGTNTALQKLKDQITCSICLETYTDPKVLPCLHVHCQKCLRSLQLQSIDNKTIQCPSCRQNYTTDVATLQPAFFIHSNIDGYNAMKKALENQDETLPPRCVNCPDSEAVGFCKDCEDNFCKPCQKAHSKKSKKHTIIKIKKGKGGKGGKEGGGGGKKGNQKESKQVEEDLLLQDNTNTCSVHPSEELKVFCETCNSLICRECILSDHRTHNYYLAKEAAAKRKEDILTSLKPVEKEAESLGIALARVQVNSVQVKVKGELVKQEVKEKVDKLQSALEIRKTALLLQLDRVVDERVKILSTQENQLSIAQAQSLSFIRISHISLDISTDEELMAVKADIAKQAKEMLTSARKVSKEPKETTALSVLSNDQLLTECRQYGIVVSKKADLFYVGETVKASPLLKEVLVPIQVQRSYQALSGSINIQQKVTASNKITVVPSKLVRRPGTSTSLVSFRSSIRGACYVNITVNFEPIRKSPVCVFMYSSTPTKVIKLDKPDMVAVTTEQIVVVGDSRRSVTIYSKHGGNEVVRSFQLMTANSYPRGVAVDNENFLLVTDQSNSSITKYKPSGSIVKTIGREGSEPLQFSGSCGIAIDRNTGKIYIADQNNHRIQVLNSDLTFSHMFGVKGQAQGQFNQPRDVAVIENEGSVFVADRSNNRIQVFTPGGKFIREFGKKGDGDGQLNLPVGLCIDPSFQYVLVTDFGNDRISIFSCQGTFIASYGKRGSMPGEFTSPYGIAIDRDGYTYVADYANNRIQIF